MGVTDAWRDQVLAQHNQARAQYGARPLYWSHSLYSGVLQLAHNCRFHHSDLQARYGENLYAGTGSAGIQDAMNSWMDEASKYDYNHPGVSPATGRFTQVVWKSTTGVAAAIVHCPAGTIFPQPSVFIVARYTPPGNAPGAFPQNVGRHV
ncbi:CAP domain-containing protein [Amycolatopsis sp. EV170708-02-1]|uniref:CAP domain-containing protein n=1 Tax=Amycolatopsis sp. EV170708-02-1 TaxID=2919322 RepID=UPI001F0C0DF3|nr:CAP domain-containing protein [Amycolatopsis sp. EV170708-02-1]UMP06788.1 CAP domain-containing protein [Amycolatopsis sp. EV170708-02-1]